MDICVISTFWLLWIMLLWTFMYKYMFSVLWGVSLGIELLGHTVILCLTYWVITKLFSTAAAPFYIPTSNVWGFRFPHIFSKTYFPKNLSNSGYPYSMITQGLRQRSNLSKATQLLGDRTRAWAQGLCTPDRQPLLCQCSCGAKVGDFRLTGASLCFWVLTLYPAQHGLPSKQRPHWAWCWEHRPGTHGQYVLACFPAVPSLGVIYPDTPAHPPPAVALGGRWLLV